MGDLLAGWGLEVTLKRAPPKRGTRSPPSRSATISCSPTRPCRASPASSSRARSTASVPARRSILYTGYGDDIPERELRAAKVCTLARKPVEPAELFALLRTSLKQNHNTAK